MTFQKVLFSVHAILRINMFPNLQDKQLKHVRPFRQQR